MREISLDLMLPTRLVVTYGETSTAYTLHAVLINVQEQQAFVSWQLVRDFRGLHELR